jgi:hypothetical protein
VTPLRCQLERGPTMNIRVIRIRAAIEKQLDDVIMTLPRCNMQWC